MRSLLPLLLLSCAPKTEAPVVAPTPEPVAPPPLPAYAENLLSAMDSSVSPCDDFYAYACGNWIKNTPLPSDKPSWTRSFSVIREQNRETLRKVLEEAAADTTSTDPDRRRLGNWYGSCMDEPGIEKAGITPLDPLLKDIDTLKDVPSFMVQAGKLQLVGVPALFTMYVTPGLIDPTVTIIDLAQGGLSLPDRDYYLKAENAELLAAYEVHIAKILALSGIPEAEAAKQAKAVVGFEKAYAEISLPMADLRDPDKINHKLDRAGLIKITPGLKWDGFLDASGAAGLNDINVETPEVFRHLASMLKKTDTGTLKAYLRWQLLHAYAGTLPKAYFDETFAFFGQQVYGQKAPEDRWKRCVNSTDATIGELAGKAYIDAKFSGDSKDIAATLMRSVQEAFTAGLPKLAWMDDPTRARAIEKMKAMNLKIGYPDRWRDYTNLSLSNNYAANKLAAARFETVRQLAKVGKAPDRGEWYMTPSTVNAYYDPSLNEMVFPAGILQAPFFDRSFPAAMNYGAIGMVMGHELSHGFDDSGRKFDGQGRLVEWWAPEVSARFDTQTACVKNQYAAYEPQPGLFVKGDLTLGENIADLGGTRLAYRAFKAQNAPAANIPGLTDDQLFFVAMAQGWCSVSSPAYEKMQVLSNSHSPPKYRVNGPLANLPEFHAAFSCAEGSKMRPAGACEVW